MESYDRFKSILNCRVIGLLEIGSFARGEAVSTSDRDLRLVVQSGEPFLLLREQTWTQCPAVEVSFLDWSDINEFDDVSFGISNVGFIERCIQDGRYPLNDHTCMYQGQILLDDQGMVKRFQDRYAGARFANIVGDYVRQTGWRVTSRLREEAAQNRIAPRLDRRKQAIPTVQTCCRIARDIANIDTYRNSMTYIADLAALDAYYQREWSWFYQSFRAMFAIKTDEEERRKAFAGLEKNDAGTLRHLQQLHADTLILWGRFEERFAG
jgi:hypothetical protein